MSRLDRRHQRGPSIDGYFRCSDQHYFAAGNVLRGIETAGQCWREGKAAAEMVIARLESRLPARQPDARVTLQGPLAYVYPQRIYRDAPTTDPLLFKARVAHEVRGRLSVDGRRCDRLVARISALPERRIAWKLPGENMRNCQQVSVELDALTQSSHGRSAHSLQSAPRAGGGPGRGRRGPLDSLRKMGQPPPQPSPN